MQPIPPWRLVFDLLLFGFLWIPIPLMFFQLHPYERGFYCSDISIRYPFKKGTISSTLLYSVGTILPVIMILAVEAYRTYVIEPRAFHGGERIKPRYSLFRRAIPPYVASLYFYLGYFFFGMSMNFLITALGKYSIGRLRPHFVDVCKPANLTTYCSQDPYAYIAPGNMFCTGDPNKVRSARVSFPSGHSSFSAYAMFYLILYLHCRLIWPIGGLLTKHVFQFIALFLTVATTLSRVSDYKHHWSDALVGFILGTIMAFITAYGMAGFSRRPQSIFARHGPYDSSPYTGGQLINELSDMRPVEPAIVDGKEMV